MAKSKLTADIPGIGAISVEGNHATEDSIQDLISIMESRVKISNKEIGDFNDDVSKASVDLTGFSDSIDDAEKKTDKAAKNLASFAAKSSDASMGLQKFADSGGSLSSVIESVGEVMIGIGRGIGGVVPLVGGGLEELTGAAATAAVGLTAAAVGMIEGFQGLNKQIFNSGLQIQGGFGQFADYANDANLPVGEFANAMLLSSSRLRLFAGAAPGGIQQVSKALKEFHDDGIMENLYSLGFTTEDVVAGMSDYAIAAERQGKRLSTAELAAGSEQYLKNLRELSRITGTSIKETQAQIEADRSNLFVQRELMKVAPGQRAAAEAFAAQLDALGLGPMKDFIISGQSMSTQSGIMSTQMSETATVLQNAYQQIANGNVEAENVSALLRTSLSNNSGAINTELNNLINTFGVSPQLAQDFGDLGIAARGVVEMVNAARTEMSGGTEIEAGSIQENLGLFETTLNTAQASIQNVFIESLEGTSPYLGALAESAKLAAAELNKIVDAFAEGTLNDYFKNAAGTLAGQTGNNGSPGDIVKDLVKEEIGGGAGLSLGPTTFAAEMDRFLNDPGGFTLEERQDLINSIRDKQREDSNLFVDFLGFTGGVLGDVFGNLDARISSDDDIIESINAIKAGAEFATGGISSGPESGYNVKLHGTEAVVPLPDGNSIPVSLTSGGMGSMIDSIISQTSTELGNKFDESVGNLATMSVNLDDSKTLSEMLQVNKNMLTQMLASSQKTDQMLRAMENANLISRTTAYVRA